MIKHRVRARLAVLGAGLVAGSGGMLLAPAAADAAFVGVTTTLVAQPTIDGLEWDVWRVYVQVTNPLDQITFCSGNDVNPVMIATDGPSGFYQNETFGESNTEPNSALFPFDPDLAHDTFVTIGTEVLSEAPTQTQGFITPGWQCDRLILRNGAWYRVPDQPQTVVGPSLQLLIGQFTIDRGATLAGKLRIAGVFDGDSSNYYVTHLPVTLCDSDVDGDEVIGIDDFVEVILGWGTCDDICACPSDVTKDGVVDVEDLVRLLADWGVCE